MDLHNQQEARDMGSFSPSVRYAYLMNNPDISTKYLASLWGMNEVTPPKVAVRTTRAQDFSQWYQEVVQIADLAENASIKGCMVVKPNGWAIWESIQQLYNAELRKFGVKNAAFPLMIPLEYFQREAEHADGFATEVAVVTHRRLEKDVNGKLQPTTPLEEPLVVRPTSEMVIGDSMSRWIQSYRDLPLKLNQWCSVVRMEMRPRIFLRSTEFWWHEGHSAHADMNDAVKHIVDMHDVYAKFLSEKLALPFIKGRKIAQERFAGAEDTFSIEAIMQDGKALQAATAHYLGTSFADAMGIHYQDNAGRVQIAHTTSWGMSTRLIGALIMTHGDDYGIRLPPKIAPLQVAIVASTIGTGTFGAIKAHATKVNNAIENLSYDDQLVKTFLDCRDIGIAQRRWEYMKQGVPLVIEIGNREAKDHTVSIYRRDALQQGAAVLPYRQFIEILPNLLEEIQNTYRREALTNMANSQLTNIDTPEQLRKAFKDNERKNGWLIGKWCGDEDTLEVLKELRISIRCIHPEQSEEIGECLLSGRPATIDVVYARAY